MEITGFLLDCSHVSDAGAACEQRPETTRATARTATDKLLEFDAFVTRTLTLSTQGKYRAIRTPQVVATRTCGIIMKRTVSQRMMKEL